MSCSIKERLVDTVKDEIKKKATSYKEVGDKVFIPFNIKGEIKDKRTAFKIATDKSNKLNNKYEYWAKGDITSVDFTPRDGVYINIHPTKAILDFYEGLEARNNVSEDEQNSENRRLEQDSKELNEFFNEEVDIDKLAYKLGLDKKCN